MLDNCMLLNLSPSLNNSNLFLVFWGITKKKYLLMIWAKTKTDKIGQKQKMTSVIVLGR